MPAPRSLRGPRQACSWGTGMREGAHSPTAAAGPRPPQQALAGAAHAGHSGEPLVALHNHPMPLPLLLYGRQHGAAGALAHAAAPGRGGGLLLAGLLTRRPLPPPLQARQRAAAGALAPAVGAAARGGGAGARVPGAPARGRRPSRVPALLPLRRAARAGQDVCARGARRQQGHRRVIPASHHDASANHGGCRLGLGLQAGPAPACAASGC